MSKRFLAPAPLQLVDGIAERVRRSHMACILELQAVPIVGGVLARGVALADGAIVPIGHSLGRQAAVWCSAPRCSSSATAGVLREVRDASIDPTKFCALSATGWGETVTVDAWIF